MKPFLTAICMLACLPVCFSQANFADMTDAAGLQQTGKNYGTVVADFDNDGHDDIFAFRLLEPCALYRNLGDGSFEEMATEAGVDYVGTPYSAVWGDIDNDGFPDLFIGNRDEGSVLYHNNQDGTFSNITATAGVGEGGKVRATLFADVDRDGFLDLYVARLGQENFLYRNNGNLSFSNITLQSGATDPFISMGAVFFDYDNDGDPDLYLTHDANIPFILYRNNGTGQFADVSVQSGANIAAMGMGVDVGDFNNDGWMDIYVTNLFDNVLLLNNANPTPWAGPTFTNIAVPAGVNDSGMGWGCVFLDYDSDGWQDIYMVNDSYFSPKPNLLYRNKADNTFEIVSENTPLTCMEPSYGVSTADFNGDGRVDISLANFAGQLGNRYFQNTEANGNNWLKIKLIGTESNRMAIGARVAVRAGGLLLTDELNAGSGYVSQNSQTLHFGLGAAPIADSLTVRWPNGLVQVFYNLLANQVHVFTEGETPGGGDPGGGGGDPGSGEGPNLPGGIGAGLPAPDTAQGFLTDGERLGVSAFVERPVRGGRPVVFPNPFHDRFQVQFPANETWQDARLYDLTGREVAVFLSKTQALLWDFEASQLVPGVYLLKLTNGTKTVVGILCKQ